MWTCLSFTNLEFIALLYSWRRLTFALCKYMYYMTLPSAVSMLSQLLCLFISLYTIRKKTSVFCFLQA